MRYPPQVTANFKIMQKLADHWVHQATWRPMPKMNQLERCCSLFLDNAAPKMTSSGRFWKVESCELSGRMSLSALSLTCAGGILLELKNLWTSYWINQNVRNKARDSGHQPPMLEIQDEDGFERNQEIKKLGFNDQILIVSSTLLGETASDTKSFTLRLTQAFRLQG